LISPEVEQNRGNARMDKFQRGGGEGGETRRDSAFSHLTLTAG